MGVTGIGDCLKEGRYLLHSLHRRAAYFVCGKSVISLVTSAAGNGPNHIVCSDSKPPRVRRIVVRRQVVELDETAHLRCGKMTYVSKIPPPPGNHASVKKNLDALNRGLCAAPPPGSMPALARNAACESGSFERLLAIRLAAGSRALREGDYHRGIGLLLGAGSGLTPSGDDFIAGFAAGLCFMHGPQAAGPRAILRSILRNAERTNLVSRTMLLFSCRGRVYERTKNLLIALAGGSEEEVEHRALSLMETGHASGADFAYGLLCSLQDSIFG
jgi:hypothetical protein